ncbi:SHQ1-domain-containing protein [Abortiporus biennis]|nr:SHQ1-domain-containing protein [Abortiporus biennis]
MITPRFSCSQNEESVVVKIYCPSVRASDVEINVDDTLFTVHINPYYLRLNFSQSLLEDDESSAQYDPSSGYLTVTLTKAEKGQVFKDLDLLSKLLAPRLTEPPPGNPIIEVLDSDDAADIQTDEDALVQATESLTLEQNEILEAAESDWQLKQEVPEPLSSLRTSPTDRYGFLDSYSGYFTHVEHTENEVNELGSEAETLPKSDRRKHRIEHEEKKWDEEYYLADYADGEHIQELLCWRHPHLQLPDVSYTPEEELAMLNLPRKEYLASPLQTRQLYLTLLTLLFAYAYESRTTQHDPTPESGWTLGILIPAFSALDPPPYTDKSTNDPSTFSIEEVISTFVASYRRSLAFPLYRSFALAESCRSDVASFLSKGRRMVLRCLLEMKYILDHHDVYYVYSKIWIDDFCVWIQANASDETLHQLGSLICSLKIPKADIGWDLEELEALVSNSEVGREADSDDESEDEVERMLPTPL